MQRTRGAKHAVASRVTTQHKCRTCQHAYCWNRVPCKFFMSGRCAFGDGCRFSHDTTGGALPGGVSGGGGGGGGREVRLSAAPGSCINPLRQTPPAPAWASCVAPRPPRSPLRTPLASAQRGARPSIYRCTLNRHA
jgi:hypothetical protein